MGRPKPQVKKVSTYGVICYKLGGRFSASSAPQYPVEDTPLMVMEPFPRLSGGRRSIFDPRRPVNLGLAQPLPKKRKAAKTAADRDAKALRIDGNQKLDPRKPNPTMFGLQTADDRRGMTTRGLMKAASSGSGERDGSVLSMPQKRAKRKATEAGLSQIKTEMPPIQDAFKAALSRHDSVAAGLDSPGDVEAIPTQANGLLSSPAAVVTADGTKRRKTLPNNDEVVESLMSDRQMIGVFMDTSLSQIAVPSIKDNSAGSRTIAKEDATIPVGLSAAEGREKESATTATISKPAKRKRTLKAELEIDGTPALGRTATTNADRYHKSYKAADGRWYSWLGTEKPDWAIDDRDVDLDNRM